MDPALRKDDKRVALVKLVGEVEEDPASGGTKCYVTLGLPINQGGPRGTLDLQQFFESDPVKRLAIKEAMKCFNRQAGWSDIGRLVYFKGGEPCNSRDEADEVRVRYACSAAP